MTTILHVGDSNCNDDLSSSIDEKSINQVITEEDSVSNTISSLNKKGITEIDISVNPNQPPRNGWEVLSIRNENNTIRLPDGLREISLSRKYCQF
jgi:hypothetical protein